MSNSTRQQKQRNAKQLRELNYPLSGTVGNLRFSKNGNVRMLSVKEIKRLNKPHFNINQT